MGVSQRNYIAGQPEIVQDMSKQQDIKLMISDLDGTLLNSAGELPIEIFDLIPALRKAGVYFAIATGRQYSNIRALFGPVAQELIYITQNGSFVKTPTQDDFYPLDKALLKEMLDVANTLSEVYPILFSNDIGYVLKPDGRFLQTLEKHTIFYEVVEDLYETIQRIDMARFTIRDYMDTEKNSYARLYAQFSDRAKVTMANHEWMDIVSKGVNKGVAVAQLQQELGISKAQTMVFGDFDNDIEMMSQAEYSYAIGNASEPVKKAARFLAKTNDEKGVIRVIEEYFGGKL